MNYKDFLNEVAEFMWNENDEFDYTYFENWNKQQQNFYANIWMAFEMADIMWERAYNLRLNLIYLIQISLENMTDLYNAFSDDTLEDYLQNPDEYSEDIEVLNNEENPNHNWLVKVPDKTVAEYIVKTIYK